MNYAVACLLLQCGVCIEKPDPLSLGFRLMGVVRVSVCFVFAFKGKTSSCLSYQVSALRPVDTSMSFAQTERDTRSRKGTTC